MKLEINIIICMLLFVSCDSFNSVATMNVYYPHSEEYCFQLTIPKTNLYGWNEVNGDRCYIFNYPIKKTSDTSKIFISHFGFEECDCSVNYTAEKIALCYNDSILFEHFISSNIFEHSFIVKDTNSMDTFILKSTILEYDTSRYMLIEYLGYISPVIFLSDTEYRYLENAKRYVVKDITNHKKIAYLDGLSIEDTLSLDGFDEKKLYWKDVRINRENINVGCINVLPKEKRLYNKCLSTLKRIRIPSSDTNNNNLYFLPKQNVQ